MSTHSTSAMRVVSQACAIGLVGASAGFGAIFAWTVASHHSLALGVLSVGMALALEGIKPIAIAQSFQAFGKFHVFRGIALAVLGLVAVAYSFTSEISLVATSKGDTVADRLNQARSAKEAQEARRRITLELDALGIVRPSGTILGELNPILADARLNNCEGWLPSIRHRTTCIEKVAPLKAELAKAERREALLVELRTRSSTLESEDRRELATEADPGSTAIATYLNSVGVVIQVDVLAQWLVLVPVLALELGSALAVVLVNSVQGESGSTRVVHAVVQASATPNGPTPKPTHIGPTSKLARARPTRAKLVGISVPLLESPSPKRTTKYQRDVVQDRLMDQLRASGGSWRGSERELASLIGTSRPTVRRAVIDLAQEGMVLLSTSKRGTIISSPQRHRNNFTSEIDLT